MAKPSPSYGLDLVRSGSRTHSVIIIHGIRQTRDDVRPFADMIANGLPGLQVFTYGYDHTRSLLHNGRQLFEVLQTGVPQGRVDLIGYSMGGLVARIAATEAIPSNIHTVVTLATPNRGALSNTELTLLGQVGRQGLELISPIVPRSEGVRNLTTARTIMRSRWRRLIDAGVQAIDGDRRRYASVPALWYSDDKADFSFGPTPMMSSVVFGFKAIGLKAKLERMEKSHDGIVTERSNNVTTVEGNDWAEFHLVATGQSGAPPLCHAVTEACDQHDHMSILTEPTVAALICGLIDTDDWRQVKTRHRHLAHARLHPFDIRPRMPGQTP